MYLIYKRLGLPLIQFIIILIRIQLESPYPNAAKFRHRHLCTQQTRWKLLELLVLSVKGQRRRRWPNIKTALVECLV